MSESLAKDPVSLLQAACLTENAAVMLEMRSYALRECLRCRFCCCQHAVTLCAGVSVKYGYDMNSLAVPRRAKEAIGGIAALRKPDGSTLTINVEYNLLDPLLRASGWADGDVNDDTGYSPYPGAAILMCCRKPPWHPNILCTL